MTSTMSANQGQRDALIIALQEAERDRVPQGDEEFAVFDASNGNVVLERGFASEATAETRVRNSWQYYRPGAWATQVCPDHRHEEPTAPRGECPYPHEY